MQNLREIKSFDFVKGYNGCWDETKLQFVVKLDGTPNGAKKRLAIYCRENSGNLENLAVRTGRSSILYVFEEKMSWRLD